MARMVRVIVLLALVTACVSSTYAGAESVIVRLDPPVPYGQEYEQFKAMAGPGLRPLVAYFYVPTQQPTTVGKFPATGGDELAEVAASFAEDGRTGLQDLRIYGIGFEPARPAGQVDAAVERFKALGFDVSTCSVSVALGGCPLYPPSP